MMGWADLFIDKHVVAFLLLFFRFGSLFLAVPIFSHQNIPMNVKASMAFFFTIVFYSSVPPLTFEINLPNLIIAVLGEFLFGLAVGIILLLAFHVITFAGGQISYMMGFSMASAIDPQTGISMPIVSQFLSLMGLMMLVEINLHHWMIIYINNSLSAIPLGGFLMTKDLLAYITKATINMFVVGFMIAFPIIALSWLADVIFGMLMKTMPQFNLLVIGFPIKIMVAFSVLIAILTSIMLLLKHQIIDAFNTLNIFF
ncbi:Flagellar biosynthesis protein FliR [hydrothermal vent metagenome]|uniref:Flagellar biosynthesis protein FliR n=1 Tax=hydrothermal vent metagenome TaxID=652676 RepID=A0A1W1D2Y4_9ZZZZ